MSEYELRAAKNRLKKAYSSGNITIREYNTRLDMLNKNKTYDTIIGESPKLQSIMVELDIKKIENSTEIQSKAAQKVKRMGRQSRFKRKF